MLETPGTLNWCSSSGRDHRGAWRLSPVLVASLCLWVGCGGEPGDPEDRAPPDGPDLRGSQCVLGLAGVTDGRGWNLLQARLVNRGTEFDGELLVNGRVFDPRGEIVTSRLTYRRHVVLPTGETREVELPVRTDNWVEILVRLRQPGFEERLVFPVNASLSHRLRFLIVGQRPPGFGPLGDWVKASYLDRPGQESVQSGGQPAQPAPLVEACEIASLRPVDLPTVDRGLEPFHVIFLYGTALVGMQEQLATLREWVLGGGVLVALPGPDWTAGIPEDLKSLLRIRWTENSGIPVSRELLLYGGAREGGIHERIAPAPGASAVLEGLAIRARQGAGEVVTLRFQPAWSVLPRPEEFPPLYTLLAGRIQRALSFAGSHEMALNELERASAPILFSMSGFEIPSRGKVAGGLALYLLVGFLVPAFLFKKLRRREWTFAVIVLASSLATLGIYQYGLLSSIEAREIEEISVLRLHDDGRTADATSLLGVIDPALGRFSIMELIGDAGIRETLFPQPLRGQVLARPYMNQGSEIPILSSSLEWTPGGNYSEGPVTLYPNAMRYWRCDYRIDARDALRMEYVAPRTDSQLPLRLTNGTSDRVDLYVVRDGKYSRLRQLDAGATEVLDCPLIPDGTWHDRFDWPDQVRREIHRGYYYYGGQIREPPSGVLPESSQLGAAVLSALRVVARPEDRIYPDNTGAAALQYRTFQSAVVAETGRSPVRSTVMTDYLRRQPAYLVALLRTPVLPIAQGEIRRRGATLLVAELDLASR